MNISFVGLGNLGLPLAYILAEKGNRILGVDKSEYTLDILKSGQLPFFEPNLEHLQASSKDNIIGLTSSFERAVQETDAMIILVNTQIGDSGYASDYVEEVIIDAAINLKQFNKEYFMFILSSTVLPGTINKKLIPCIERIPGKTFGKDFGFSYVPDFVKLGSVIHDFKNPEFFLIGSNNDKDYMYTKKIFEGIHENNCSQYKLTLEETEIAKISLNAYLINKITFANFLGILCRDIHNVNVHNITEVIGIDKRISPYFFRSGAPYGGTCFLRDTTAFIQFSKNHNEEAKHLMFAEQVNEKIHCAIFEMVKQYKNIGILGMSFKPNSAVTVGSPSVILADSLLENQNNVFYFDRVKSTSINIHKSMHLCDSGQECIHKSDVVVVMHFDKYFLDLDYTNKKVVDVWGLGIV